MSDIGPNGAPRTGGMVIDIKGMRSVTVTRMFGTEVHIVTDLKAQKRTTWMPKPPGQQLPPQAVAAGAVNGLMFTNDLHPPPSSASRGAPPPTPPTLNKLGTSEIVAGVACDDYEVARTRGGPVTRLCLTRSLGRFSFPEAPAAPGSPSTAPEWSRAYGDEPLFPLKVWSPNGSSSWEVTSIRRHPVADSLFVVPPGYADMAKIRGPAVRGHP